MRVAALLVTALLVVVPALALRDRPLLGGRKLVEAIAACDSSTVMLDKSIEEALLAHEGLPSKAGVTSERLGIDGMHRVKHHWLEGAWWYDRWTYHRWPEGLLIVATAQGYTWMRVLDAEGEVVGGALRTPGRYVFQVPDSTASFARVELDSVPAAVFALTSRGFVLVRFEGTPAARDWILRKERKWDTASTLALLGSRDPNDVLRALASLPGKRRPEIVKRLHELEASENAWVREAARLALEDR